MSATSSSHASTSHSSSFKRLVLLHQGALGDFLLALPVVEGLHLCHPSLRIDFWTKREHGDLIGGKPYAGEVHPIDGPELTPFFHEDLWRSAPIPPSLARCDAALIFGQAGSRLVAERLSGRLSCPVHWIRSFPERGRSEPHPAVHVSRFLMEQVGRLGWCVQETIPRLELSEAERSDVREWLARNGWRHGEKPAVIHPGSGGRGKIWPLSRWWALLYWMRKAYDLPVILTLGPADEYLVEFAGAARDLVGAHPVEGLTLRRLAALLAESRFYLGNDSGVSHLAAAVGIPAGVIFGPTNPAVWAPIGPNVQIIRSQWEEPEVLDWPPTIASPPVEPAVMDWVNLQSC